MIELTLHFDCAESTLFFDLGDRFFPEENWIDLVSVDLERWIPALTSFFQGHTDSCRLDFMDGPFSVHLHRGERGIGARFQENNRDCLPECSVDTLELVRSVAKSLRAMNRARFEAGEEPLYTKEHAILNQILRN